MKLCIIVSNSLRKDPRVIKQIKCALNDGIDVHFIGYRDVFYSKAFLDSVDCEYSIVDLGDTFVGPLKSIYKKIIRRFYYYLDPIKFIIKIKPDVIHANDFDTLIQAYIASKIIKCKVLYDSHEVCAENIGLTDKKIQKNLIIIIERFIVKRIGSMVSVSNAASMYFSKKYKIVKPVVITNVPYRVNNIMLHSRNSDKFEVLYQGLMLKGRGYEEFVKSGKFVNNIQLVIRGYGSLENDLRKIIIDESLENIVKFDGPVEVKDIVLKASESHMGVVLTQPVNLNFKLSVSNKLFEYIHAGLPVLLSDIPEHQYLNREFNFGIILKDFSPLGIAKCINELAVDKEKYAFLKSNAIKASEILCWENESIKLIKLYHQLSLSD
jgi:glycosyltransferase involved in cell wall biosynthesis